MPTISIHPRPQNGPSPRSSSGLPHILQTPSGLAILEIQGTINTSDYPTGPGDTPEPIGKLTFPGYDASKGADDTSWHKRVYLYIGKHQRLTGEVKNLAKPIAVLQRREGVEGDELEVAEIVRFKVLFAHRPEPVGAGAEVT